MRRVSESQWRLAALFYLALAVLALGVTLVVRDGHPLDHPHPWLSLSPALGLALSAVLGLALAALVASTTRVFVAHFAWARALQGELSPSTYGLTAGPLLLLAALSSAAEELFFRALLEPTAGLLVSSVLFGLAHRVRGASRWVWAAWAAAVGLGLGGIYHLTGSLLGALLAHALINTINLFFLRDSALGAKRSGEPRRSLS